MVKNKKDVSLSELMAQSGWLFTLLHYSYHNNTILLRNSRNQLIFYCPFRTLLSVLNISNTTNYKLIRNVCSDCLPRDHQQSQKNILDLRRQGQSGCLGQAKENRQQNLKKLGWVSEGDQQPRTVHDWSYSADEKGGKRSQELIPWKY